MDKSQFLRSRSGSNYGEYRQEIGLGQGVIDIPNGYEMLDRYNGSMGHKLNHKFFYENCWMSFVRNFHENL